MPFRGGLRLLAALFILLAVPALSAFEVLNRHLVFYADQDKEFLVRSSAGEEIQVSIYRIDRPLDFIEREWTAKVTAGRSITVPLQAQSFEADALLMDDYLKLNLSGFDFEPFRPYGVRFLKRYTERIGRGDTRVFIPVREDGLYLVGLRTARESRLFVMNVTELALFVKRDADRTVLYTTDRRTGGSVGHAKVLAPLLPAARRGDKRVETDEVGLLSLPNGLFQSFSRITAVVSNSLDVVDAPAWIAAEENPWKAVSLVDRGLKFSDEDLTVTTFFFQKDEFREYSLVPAQEYFLVFDGATNRIDVAGAAVHQARLSRSGGAPPGRHELLTIFRSCVFTNRVDVAVRNDRRIFLDVRPARTVWFAGQTASVKVTGRSFGRRTPSNKGLSVKVSFVDRREGTLRKEYTYVRRPFRGTAVFRIPTRAAADEDCRVRIEADLKTSDGAVIKSFGDMFVFRDAEDARMTVDRRILRPGETVNARVEIRNNRDPFKVRRGQIVLVDLAASSKPVVKIPVETKKDYTNIAVPLGSAGPYRIELRYGPRGRFTRSETVWVLPDHGDIPLPAFAEDPSGFTVVPDKDGYSYGDIAKVLIMSARKEIDGLFSFEGNGLFETRRLAFENNYEVVDIPILEKNKPNGFLKIESMVSNRFLSVSREVSVPAASKRIVYDIGVTTVTRERQLRMSTENIFARPVKSFSLSDFSASFWNEPSRPDAFGWLYPREPDKVVFYGHAEKAEPAGTPAKSERPRFEPPAPAARDMYPAPVGQTAAFFLDESSTNRLTVRDSDFNGLDRVAWRLRSVTADGKIGSTNYWLSLGGTLRRETQFPPYLHPEDRGGFCAYLQNLQNTGQKVRLYVEFNGRDEIMFRTNSSELGGGRDTSMRFRIPDVFRRSSGVRCRLKLVSYEFNDEVAADVPVIPFPWRTGTSRSVSVSKTYRVLGRELGSAFFPASPVCHMEDIIKVTLKVRVRNAFDAVESVSNAGRVLKDVIPSGCRILKTGPATSAGYEEEDRICFPLPEGRESVVLVYYLSAELPGRYAIYPALAGSAAGDFLTRKRSTPLGEVTVLY